MGAPIPNAGSKSKVRHPASSEIELSSEVLNAVSMATVHRFYGRSQLRRLGLDATSVWWHDQRLNTLVSLRAAEELAWERLASPDICRDLKLWAQHGYRAIPATSHAFLKQWGKIEQLVPKALYGSGVRAIGSEPVTKTILIKLMPYENSVVTKRLGALVDMRERRVQQDYTATALNEASRLYHGLGFDYCGTDGQRRCD